MAIHSLEEKMDFVLKRISPLYRNRELIRSAISIAINPDDPAHQFYRFDLHQRQPAVNRFGVMPRTNGFVAAPGQLDIPESLVQNVAQFMALKLRGSPLDEGRLATLGDFLMLAEGRGIKVVLVTMPVSSSWRALWGDDAALDRYLAAVRSVAKQHDVPLFDLYQETEEYIPADGFWDWHHLNEDGARILTDHMTRACLADLFIPEGRGEMAKADRPAARCAVPE